MNIHTHNSHECIHTVIGLQPHTKSVLSSVCVCVCVCCRHVKLEEASYQVGSHSAQPQESSLASL